MVSTERQVREPFCCLLRSLPRRVVEKSELTSRFIRTDELEEIRVYLPGPATSANQQHHVGLAHAYPRPC